MMSLIVFLAMIVLFLIFAISLANAIDGGKSISLYVLVDKDERISYTGTYNDCKKQLTKELKLIKLEGII